MRNLLAGVHNRLWPTEPVAHIKILYPPWIKIAFPPNRDQAFLRAVMASFPLRVRKLRLLVNNYSELAVNRLAVVRYEHEKGAGSKGGRCF